MKAKFFLLTLLVLLLSGCSTSSEKPSKIRIGQFLFTDDPVDIRFKRNDEIIIQNEINYGELTTYKTIKSGIYNVEVKSADKLLLNKKIGIGTDGIYTLIINGIPKENQETNERTPNLKLHEIVEGEEAIYSNGNLPQMRILNDEFECGSNEAKIRWINLAAGVQEVNASAETNSNSTDLSSLTYPKASKNFAISVTDQELKWKLKGKKIEIAHKKINTESRTLYTCFLIANKGKYADSLKVVLGETPKKEF